MANHSHETPDVSNIHNSNVGHEVNDINTRAIIRFIVALALATFVVFGLMYLVMRFLQWREASRDTPVARVARPEGVRLPPHPRLQGAKGHEFRPEDVTNDPAIAKQLEREKLNFELEEPTEEWDALREVKLRELQTYGTNQLNPGEYRIPIDRAKELLLERNQLVARPSGAEATQAPETQGYDELPTYPSSGRRTQRRMQ